MWDSSLVRGLVDRSANQDGIQVVAGGRASGRSRAAWGPQSTRPSTSRWRRCGNIAPTTPVNSLLLVSKLRHSKDAFACALFPIFAESGASRFVAKTCRRPRDWEEGVAGVRRTNATSRRESRHIEELAVERGVGTVIWAVSLFSGKVRAASETTKQN